MELLFTTGIISTFIDLSLMIFLLLNPFPYGLAVTIPGFHPGGLFSTPGMGKNILSFGMHMCNNRYHILTGGSITQHNNIPSATGNVTCYVDSTFTRLFKC